MRLVAKPGLHHEQASRSPIKCPQLVSKHTASHTQSCSMVDTAGSPHNRQISCWQRLSGCWNRWQYLIWKYSIKIPHKVSAACVQTHCLSCTIMQHGRHCRLSTQSSNIMLTETEWVFNYWTECSSTATKLLETTNNILSDVIFVASGLNKNFMFWGLGWYIKWK